MKKKIHIVASGVALLVLVSYQACTSGGFNVLVADMQSLSSFSLSQSNADIVWSLKGKSGISLSRLSQVQRWTDANGQGVSLYPPVMPGTVQLDLDKAPTMLQTDQGSLLFLGAGSTLANLIGDLSVFLSQEYTMAFYVRSVVINTEAPKLARIVEFYPADNSASGNIGVDFWDIGGGQVQVSAFDYFDGSTNAFSYVKIPAADLETHGYGVVARFTNDASGLSIAVNGVSGTLGKVGTVPMLGKVVRQLVLHGQGGGIYGNFALGEFAIWKHAISEDDAKAYSLMLQQSYELGGTTITLPGGDPTGGNGGSGKKAYSSIQGTLNVCMNCHTQVLSRSSILNAVGADGSTPWITPGSAQNSLMIRALQHQAGAMPMPKNTPALSAAQIEQISIWIDQGAN